MVDADDSAELRMLRAKAYGPGGELSSAELERLQELEGRGAAATLSDPHPVPPHEDLFSGALSERSETNRGERPEGVEASAPDEELSALEEEPSAPDDEAPNPPRRRWPLLAVASIAILAAGLGIGWGIWGQQTPSIPLTDEQRSWQDELVSEDDYDPGSVVAVKEHEGVVAWVATKDVGAQSCLLLSNGTDSSTLCRLTDQVLTEGLWSELSVPDSSDASVVTMTRAMAIFDADGRPAVRMDQFQNYTNGVPQFDPAVQPIVDRLVERGYSEGSLWIVGYFEDSPIWQTYPSDGRTESCLVYTATDDDHEICAEQDDLSAGLTLNILDDEGAQPRAIEMTLAFPRNGAPQYLTITVRPATGVLVDGETGDVIEFTTDEPMFDDLVADDSAIDDKTGEIGE